MRVGVYSIAKNEAQHVQRWAESAADADQILLLDTGSTDGTLAAAKHSGVVTASTTVDPWRFDTARNQALDLMQSDLDYVIALDLDEVLLPGWRAELEKMHANGVTRPRYKYTWSWDGSKPGLQYGGDKIHTREGYHWKHPVHEVITPNDGFTEVQGWCGLQIHHHPDPSKSRGQYLPLLELAVREDPADDRNAHYYARELFYAGRHMDAFREFQRHLDLPSARWGAERAQSLRFMFKITKDTKFLVYAWHEDPGMREACMDAAHWFYELEEWDACFLWARRALDVTVRPLSYMTESEAWGSKPHDLAAVSAYQLGLFQEALWHGMNALRVDPYDERLVRNLEWYRGKAAA